MEGFGWDGNMRNSGWSFSDSDNYTYNDNTTMDNNADSDDNDVAHTVWDEVRQGAAKNIYIIIATGAHPNSYHYHCIIK